MVLLDALHFFNRKTEDNYSGVNHETSHSLEKTLMLDTASLEGERGAVAVSSTIAEDAHSSEGDLYRLALQHKWTIYDETTGRYRRFPSVFRITSGECAKLYDIKHEDSFPACSKALEGGNKGV
ncbi:MAG: hypothetical protein MK137_02785 [Rickettsiales bacterium]|nr:hypothetical protein [Rickettsiales bacterium]